jgi:hypothetical protein
LTVPFSTKKLDLFSAMFARILIAELLAKLIVEEILCNNMQSVF